MIAYDRWRIAYAKQALADLAAREALLRFPGIPECQSLHFLQMACEKVCKAYLCGQGEDPETLRRSHAYISGPLPVIARQQLARMSGGISVHQQSLMPALRSLARKIELLAPAVNADGKAPANCEYPWIGSKGVICVPCEHNFQLNLLYEKAGRYMLKALYLAAEDLSA